MGLLKLRTYRNRKNELWVVEKEFRRHVNKVFRLSEDEDAVFIAMDSGPDLVLMTFERYEQLKFSQGVVDYMIAEKEKQEAGEAPPEK